MKALLGIDWGATFIKAGIVSPQGQIRKKIVFTSQGLQNKDIFIRQVQALLAQFKGLSIKAVGIGAPGIVNVQKGFIYYLPNIPGWENYPLRDILQKQIKLPIFINNDANAFALAETLQGAAKGVSRAICLTIGTGLGGAVVFNGALLPTEASAHELGHVPVSLGGRRCGCGSRGCIETYVGSRYLIKRYQYLRGKKKNIEVKDIYTRALAGEKAALQVWKEFSWALGKFLAGMVNIFNPEVIVFGGGLAGAFRLFKPMLCGVIQQEAMWPQALSVKLARAQLKDSGIIGAALLAREVVADKN